MNARFLALLASWSVLFCASGASAQDSGPADVGEMDGAIGDATTSTTGGRRCVPGQAAACSCGGGMAGAQICRDNGVYAACVCSGTDGGTGPTGIPRCVPDQAVACTCTTGRTGSQVCKSDGTYDVCQCMIIDAGPPADVGCFGRACADFVGQGALADTTNGSTCGVVPGARAMNQATLILGLFTLGLGLRFALRRLSKEKQR